MDYQGITNGGTMALVYALGELRADVTQVSQAQKLYDYRLGQLDDRMAAQAGLLAALTDQVNGELEALRERLAELEYLWSEEIMRQLTAAPATGEVVAELGAGWRIERRRCGQGIGGANGCGECAADNVTTGGYVFTPGYPAED